MAGTPGAATAVTGRADDDDDRDDNAVDGEDGDQASGEDKNEKGKDQDEETDAEEDKDKEDEDEEDEEDEDDEDDEDDDGAVTLAKCLRRFRTREQLGAADMWYCPNCKQHVEAFKKMQIWTAPEVLVLQLKRFSFVRHGNFYAGNSVCVF